MAVVGSRVSGAVRTYLNLAQMSAADGVLDIACREESMIFMNKPAVQQALQEAAAACGYRSVLLHKQGSAPAGPLPAQKPAPVEAAPAAEAPSALDQILANARKLGVEIRDKN